MWNWLEVAREIIRPPEPFVYSPGIGGDPNKLYVNLFPSNDPDMGKYIESSLRFLSNRSERPFAQIAMLNFCEKQPNTYVVYRAVSKYLKKRNILAELMIDGHGQTIGIGGINVANFLAFLQIGQAFTNKKFTERITFFGCTVGANLDLRMIKFFQNTARGLNAKIAMATTPTYEDRNHAPYRFGHFVCFHPDGSITRDERLHNPEGFAQKNREEPKEERFNVEEAEEWLMPYLQKPASPSKVAKSANPHGSSAELV